MGHDPGIVVRSKVFPSHALQLRKRRLGELEACQGHTASGIICGSDSQSGALPEAAGDRLALRGPGREAPGRVISGKTKDVGESRNGQIHQGEAYPLLGGASHLGQHGGAIRPPKPVPVTGRSRPAPPDPGSLSSHTSIKMNRRDRDQRSAGRMQSLCMTSLAPTLF